MCDFKPLRQSPSTPWKWLPSACLAALMRGEVRLPPWCLYHSSIQALLRVFLSFPSSPLSLLLPEHPLFPSWSFPSHPFWSFLLSERKWQFLSFSASSSSALLQTAVTACSDWATSSRAVLVPFLLTPRTISKDWHFVNPGIINHRQCFYFNSSVYIALKTFRSCELLCMIVEDTDADILLGHKILCSSSSFLGALNNFG